MKNLLLILAVAGALFTGCRTVSKSQHDQQSTKDSTYKNTGDSGHLVKVDTANKETVDSSKVSSTTTTKKETVKITLQPKKAPGMDSATGGTWSPDPPVRTIELTPKKGGGYSLQVPENAIAVEFDLNHSEIQTDSSGHHTERESKGAALDSSWKHDDQQGQVTDQQSTQDSSKRTRGVSLFVGLGCFVGIVVLILFVIWRIEKKLNQ